jgi:predicted RNA-binding Zn-ribbon protein involved in translation (DUF1610 family)
MCAKKKRYVLRSYAIRVIATRQPLEPAHLSTYKCPECGGWHITKMEQTADALTTD